MSCRATRRLLSAFVGGDLPVRRAAEVRAHLLDCFACARRFAGWREPFRALREEGAAVPDPPGDLWDRIRAEIDAPPSGVPARRRTPWSRVAAAVLAAGTLVGAGSWLLGRESGEPAVEAAARPAGGERSATPGSAVTPFAVEDGIDWGHLVRVEGPFPAIPETLTVLYPSSYLPWVPTMQPGRAAEGWVPIQPVAVRPVSREF